MSENNTFDRFQRDLFSILQQGLLAWNDWRLRHPETYVNLSGCDLRQLELSKSFPETPPGPESYIFRDRGIDLAYATLTSATFAGTDLTSADFHHADLGAADFSGATLWGVNFDGADLQLANFTGATLGRVIWGNCDLRGAIGLDFATHSMPSSIDIRAIRRADLPA